ncbi:MAG: hypothetical protein VX090_08075, partial [Pseudomonadota bacterium]|nr:hypothetical protein [Pseudomonadota bacterium]
LLQIAPFHLTARIEIAALLVPFDAQKQQISAGAGQIFLIFTRLCGDVFGRALQKIIPPSQTPELIGTSIDLTLTLQPNAVPGTNYCPSPFGKRVGVGKWHVVFQVIQFVRAFRMWASTLFQLL